LAFGHPDELNAPVLWRRQFTAPIGVPHPNLPSFEIDVGPFECDDLARPQPSLASEESNEVAPRVDRLRGFQQTLVVIEVVERRISSRNPHQSNRAGHLVQHTPFDRLLSTLSTLSTLLIVFGDLSCSRKLSRCTCSLLIVSSVREPSSGIKYNRRIDSFAARPLGFWRFARA
jgi:hypothetical protein